MALRVWLPLNGNLENKGISNPVIGLVGTPTIKTNGKIGQCYTMNGSNGISIAQQILPSQTPAWSFACWFSLANTTSTAAACLFSERTGGNSNGYTIFVYPNNSNMLVDDGTRWTVKPMTFVANTWYHLVVTRDSTGKKIYINGELKSSTTVIGNTSAVNANGCLIGLAQSSTALTTGNQGLIGDINDVRIYNHCLSSLEVKEISQGLILHYRLDGYNGGVGENLLSKYVSPGSQAPGATATGGRTNYYGDYGIIIPAIENADTYFRLFLNQQLEQNVQYTISCEVSGLLLGSYYRFPLFAQNNTAMGMLILDHNGICSLTFTMTYATQTAATVNGRTVYICFMDDSGRAITSGQGPITVKNFKIEKGSIATAFCKDIFDTKIDNGIVIDSSGYRNDGTLLSVPTIVADADRYQISTNFDGVDDGILIENLTLSSIINDKITYSFWIKPNGENGARSVYFGSYSGTSWSVEKTTGNLLRLYWNGSPDETCSGATIIDGVWQHIAIVKNGINDIKVYINGVQKWSSTATHNALTFPTTYRIGRDVRTGDNTPYKGQMSDFRIYATALSAEDIVTLYHTSVQIDNLNSMHGFEFIEDNIKDSIYKNGVVSNSQNINYLINNFAETNTMTNWTFGGTSPTISNGVVTLTGTAPSVTSSTFTVNPDDIIVIEIGLYLTQVSTTSGAGIYLGTKYGQSTSVFSYNFTTNAWVAGSTNNTNPYFINGYNSTDYYHCKTYLLGSNKTINDIPMPEATSTRGLYAIKLNSNTTTNIRSGYNTNTEMIIKLNDFKIYNLKEHGIVEENNSAKIGLGYLQYQNFIEK